MRRLVVCLAVVSACASQPSAAAPEPVVQSLAWLIGTWQSAEGDQVNVESWSPAGGSLTGRNETTVAQRVVHAERLEILRVDGIIVYRADPQAQSPNDFRLDGSGEGWARFVDPEHDWPQTITYRRKGQTLEAVVEGTEDGERRVATWTWTRR